MQSSQVAYDRFVAELPPPEPGYAPLQDPVEAGALARWLFGMGRTPVVALVGGDATWCDMFGTRKVCWVPGDADAGAMDLRWEPESGARAIVFSRPDELQRFLTACPDASRVALLWPRVDSAKTFMKLAEQDDWKPAAEAVARMSRSGARVEVLQLS